MTMGYAPTGTAAPTSTVMPDVVPVTLVGLNVTVIPAGAPVLVSATAPVKFVRASVRVLLPDCPCAILRFPGAAESATLGVGGAVTVTVRTAVWLVTPVLAPCTVIGYAPGATVAATLTAIADVAPVALAGVNTTVIPAGTVPVVVNATAPANPPLRAIFAVALPDCPCWMLSAAGVKVSAKLGDAVIVSCTFAVCCVTPVPVPRIVRVDVPTVALAAAVMVIVPVNNPAPIVSAEGVTPVGRPSTAIVTAPSNPPDRVIVTLSVPVPAAAAAFASAASASLATLASTIAVGTPPA